MSWLDYLGGGSVCLNIFLIFVIWTLMQRITMLESKLAILLEAYKKVMPKPKPKSTPIDPRKGMKWRLKDQ